MELRGKRVLICDCEKSMPLEGARLAKACRAAGAEGELEMNTQLCRAQLANFESALGEGQPLLVACTQEAPLFSEIAEEAARREAEESGVESAIEAPVFVNIRETAGWSEGAKQATPKIAALLAAAAEEAGPPAAVPFASAGVCLVYGKDERALEAAKRLSSRLDVTLLLAEAADILPPAVIEVPLFKGRILRASGHLGNFSIEVAGYAAALPSSRGALAFEPAAKSASSRCDLILDLSGGTPLFQAYARRDGYFRPDPDSPVAVERAIYEIADLVGEFEKPRYIRYEAEICTHGRNRKTGCTRCLDLCPVSAIRSLGDRVEIDPYICGGCGLCAAACPTGAATYQVPAPSHLLERLRRLLSAYHAAGGETPLLLLHDGRHGSEMIALMSRLGRGLPHHVLPFQLNEVTSVGIDFLAAALAYGASTLAVLVGPDKKDELAALASQMALAETVMEGLGHGGGRIHLLDQQDPDAVEEALWSLPRRVPVPAGSFLPLGGKRGRSLLALRHLYETAPAPQEVLPLPQGAPFGAIKVDTRGCTLCLACVGACPTGALLDDPDRPWLGFKEDACVQCGLCKATCPEQVITLAPRLNFGPEAQSAVKLNEADPFLCLRCGKPYGIKQSIERVTRQLAGKHWMFQDRGRIERIMMCDDCRVVAEFEGGAQPLAGAPRPRTRTTDDDLREREVEQAKARLAETEGGGKPH